MNEKNILQELRSTNATNPTTAIQGVRLEELKNRQLHPSHEQLKRLENTDIQDFFFLITEVNDVTCNVIPGSLDGVMAGPNDIVLPKSVLGQYVYLSMDMQTTVPKSALSDGFAILDDECYQRIMASCKEFADGSVGEIHPYSRAMPYISDHDDRIEYHNKQKLLLEDMQKIYSKPRMLNFPELFKIKHLSKVAGLLLVGMLATLIYLNEKAPAPTVTPVAPTRIMRGESSGFAIYSPNQAIYSDQPKIVIGGDEKTAYQVTVFDMDNEVIAQTNLTGNSARHWDDFSDKKLNAGETYKIEIKSGDKMISARDKNTFWLLDQPEKAALQTKLSKLGKIDKITGIITIKALNGNKVLTDEEIFQKAQLLYNKECYSEAYLEITELLKNAPENKEYKEMLKQSVEKLGINVKKDK